jgi:peroxiredoxin
VSVDDTLEQLKPFAAQYKMTYPVLIGLGQDAMQEAYGPMWGLPTTYLISRDGKICRKHMGLVTKEQFEKEILGLL